MITSQTNKQTNKQTNRKTKNDEQEQTLQKANVYIYSSNSRQEIKFNEFCCCVCKTVESSEIFALDFIQN